MSQTTTELKHEIQKTIGLMRTLGDEIRVNLHLAGMDAKAEWNKLEPEIAAVERSATNLCDATQIAASEVVKRLAKLRASLS